MTSSAKLDLIAVVQSSKRLQQSLLFVTSFALYFNTLHGDFVFDDAEAIGKNADVKSAWNSLEFLRNDFWGDPIRSNFSHKSYRPLTVLTFRLNHAFGGFDPFGYHLCNTVLNAFVAVMVYAFYETIVKRCGFQRKKGWLPFLAALLFALHPIHTEAVANVVGRAELQCALFFLGGFFVYDLSMNDQKLWNSKLLLVSLLSAAAMFSKEHGIMLLPFCIFYDLLLNISVISNFYKTAKLYANDIGNNNLWKGLKPWQNPLFVQLIARVSMMFGSFVSLAALRMWIVGFEAPKFTPADNPAAFHTNLFVRMLNYQYIYALNVWLLICPAWLCFDWSMGSVPLIQSPCDLRICIIFAFWSTISYTFYRLLWKLDDFQAKRLIAIPIGCLVIPFLPCVNLFVTVGFVIAERVLYLPSVGFCLLLALTLLNAHEICSESHKPHFQTAVACLLLCFAGKAAQRNAEWSSEAALFISGAKVCPENAKIHYNLGKIYADVGSRSGAERKYRQALTLNPHYEQAMNNLANLLKDQGQLQEAKQLLEHALNIRPNFATAWMNLGIVEAALRNPIAAESHYKTALRLRPSSADTYFNLGNLYLTEKRYSEAKSAWLNATSLNSRHSRAWTNLIILADDLGDLFEAELLGRKALHHVPNSPQLHFALANCLGKLEKFPEAELEFQLAIAGDPENAQVLTNLGVLYHRWGRHAEAAAAYRTALRFNPELDHLRKYLSQLPAPVTT